MQEQDRQAEAVRQLLSDYLHEQATWRRLKAVEYPEDSRNSRSAQRLDALADYVEQLPADDENLRVIAAVQAEIGDVFSPMGEFTSHLVSQFGFHAEEDFGRFLTRLASSEAEGSIDFEHEG